MSFLDGILEKQEPSERVRLALTNDLELRRMSARTLTRFAGYHYRGSADLLLRHGVFMPGRELPAKYANLVGRPQGCFANALLAAEQSELRYCEGFATTGYGTPFAHGWCVAPDGGVVELTMPTNPEVLARTAPARRHGLRFLPVEHWGYYGVTFDAGLVRAHWKEHGLPLFDRGPAELAESAQFDDPVNYSEDHDFPMLKVPYDPDRKELP